MTRKIAMALTAAFVCAGVNQVQAQDAPALPAGVTVADTAQGDTLFHTLGSCSNCHGEGGAGTYDGPGLRDGRWKLGDGSYEWLIHITQHGGYGMRNRGDEPLPMRGPTVLDSAQVRKVAAYVWAISRARRPARSTERP